MVPAELPRTVHLPDMLELDEPMLSCGALPEALVASADGRYPAIWPGGGMAIARPSKHIDALGGVGELMMNWMV